MIFDNLIVMTSLGSGIGYVLGDVAGRMKERKRNPPKPTVDLTTLRDHELLAAILDGQPVVGDANIRGGRVVPTIPVKEIPALAKELRRQSKARRGNDFLLTDLHLSTLAAAAVVVERVAEDRKLSRSLYKGLTDEEVKTIVRGALMRVFPQCREGILAGESDDADCAKVARWAVEQLFSIKGASA